MLFLQSAGSCVRAMAHYAHNEAIIRDIGLTATHLDGFSI